MKIIEVDSKALANQFLQLPVRLYAQHKEWIRPLDKDVAAVFDPATNKAFRHGECIRWIVQNEQGETVGRVAAFVNEKTVTKGNEQPTGGMGFFECINDQEIAFTLFDQCKQWLQAKGMEAMDGPVNFGSRDRWWGLLIEGYDREPNYQCNYNFPYYVPFFEAYGFQVYFYQFTFGRPVQGALAERLTYKANLIAKNPDYSFRHLTKAELPKLPELLLTVYNNAWANRSENPELTMAQAKLMVKQMKPILDLKLLYFGYFKDEPIAFFLSLPEINQIFKHVNGKLDWLGKAKFLWHSFRKTNRKAFGILFGVVPAHQGTGTDGALIMAARTTLQDEYKRYDEYEMNWIGDFNPKMIAVVEQVGGDIVKRHATYRKLFDETKPFKRAPILG